MFSFLNVDQRTLFDIIQATDFLMIKGLPEVCCKTVANMIKGRTIEQMRENFGIANDFTPEEEAKINRKEEKSKKKLEK